MITPQRLIAMRDDWVCVLAQQSVSPDAAIGPFEQLAARYSTPDRAYHNLEHLSEMLDVVERLAGDIGHPDAVRLAVWFHDAVYDTHRSDNEERSAALAEDVLGPLGISRWMLDRVAALVRATAHMTYSQSPEDRDTAALLDADLAILGATPERYSRYARDIESNIAGSRSSTIGAVGRPCCVRFSPGPGSFSIPSRTKKARSGLGKTWPASWNHSRRSHPERRE